MATKKSLPRIMYDQSQFTPIPLFGTSGMWFNGKTYAEMKKLSSYAPGNWYLYTQYTPEPFWFGAYDEEVITKEAEAGHKEFLNPTYTKKFEKDVASMYGKTKKGSQRIL